MIYPEKKNMTWPWTVPRTKAEYVSLDETSSTGMSGSSQPINQPPYQLDSCFLWFGASFKIFFMQEVWDTSILIMKLLHFQVREYLPPQRTWCREPALWAWPSSSGPCVGCSLPVVSSTFLLSRIVPFCILYTFRKYNKKCSLFVLWILER